MWWQRRVSAGFPPMPDLLAQRAAMAAQRALGAGAEQQELERACSGDPAGRPPEGFIRWPATDLGALGACGGAGPAAALLVSAARCLASEANLAGAIPTWLRRARPSFHIASPPMA